MKISNIPVRISNLINKKKNTRERKKMLKKNMLLLKDYNVSSPNIKIDGEIFICGKGSLLIGENVSINSGGIYNPAAGDGHTYFNLYNGSLIIGNNVGMSNVAITTSEKIEIGDGVAIGAGCIIADTDFHPIGYEDRMDDNKAAIRTAPIVIGKGVFLGARCIILKGVTIGEKSVIGAGSVVTKDVPAGELWAGNPARFIRKIEA